MNDWMIDEIRKFGMNVLVHKSHLLVDIMCLDFLKCKLDGKRALVNIVPHAVILVTAVNT